MEATLWLYLEKSGTWGIWNARRRKTDTSNVRCFRVRLWKEARLNSRERNSKRKRSSAGPRRLTNNAKETLVTEPLLDSGSQFELIVAWDPGRTQPVAFKYVIANGQVLLWHSLEADSPVVSRRLPSPRSDGSFAITWSITPEVKLTKMVMGLVDTVSGAKVVVDTCVSPNRGDPWTGDKTVTAPKSGT